MWRKFVVLSFFVGFAHAVRAVRDSIIDIEDKPVVKKRDKYTKKLDLKEISPKSQPVVGVQTMPTAENAASWRPKDFNFSQYTWEHNVNLVRYAGTFAAVVEYDMPLDELETLLDKLNGFYFTGGALHLIDPKTRAQHKWYQQAKFIVKYAIDQFDKGRYFPVFGICQGFEAINMIINNDRLDTLSKQTMYAQSRRVNWYIDQPSANSNTFSEFPTRLLKKMATEKYALHAHDNVIGIETYNTRPKLDNFFNILATDTARQPDGKLITFVTAIEGKHYPIAGTMFHPETQTIKITGGDDAATKGKINNKDTDAIMYEFSRVINRYALWSLHDGFHKFPTQEEALSVIYMNDEKATYSEYGIYTSITPTYGVD